MNARLWFAIMSVAAASAGCGNAPPPATNVEKLSPEPSGAPTEVADGRLGCLGNNAPLPPTSETLVLPGWIRRYTSPMAEAGNPGVKVEAFNDSGVSLGFGFASTTDGRVAVNGVPIGNVGFTGHLEATCPMGPDCGGMNFIEYHFYSSRAYTRNQDLAGWAWMITQQELTDTATAAQVSIQPNTGIAAVAVHGCDGFGVANAVLQVNGGTSGAIYIEEFTLKPGRTFTATSGRAVWPNLPPGPATIKAFARVESGGPLLLLSSAQVQIKAGVITAVDLEPRVANE